MDWILIYNFHRLNIIIESCGAMKQGYSSGKFRQTAIDLSMGDSDTVILQAVHSIRFGAVEVTIHDSRIVQIECKEKIRFSSGESKRSG